jgi:hypothetical protein
MDGWTASDNHNHNHDQQVEHTSGSAYTHPVPSAASVLITKSPPNDLPPVLSPLLRHVVRRDSARPIDDGWKL